jgi:TonB family protein
VDVTDVLRDRHAPPDGLRKMILLSLLAHGAFAAVLVLAPGSLIGARTAEPQTVMTIRLGGAGDGPLNGGFNPAAQRAVQNVVPQEELKKPDAFSAPAKKTPEMVISEKTSAKPSKSTAPIVREAPDQAKGRTPTRGTQKAFGEALTYTGAKGEGFGLSTGGGMGSGSSLDTANFCCPDYIVLMIERIRSAWQQNQGSRGNVKVKFTIQRDGRLTDPAIEVPSGSALLDTAALRAVLNTRTLNPLPAQYPNPTLGVHLTFEYQ